MDLVKLYLLLGMTWVCWCGLHSYLISSGVIMRMEARLGSLFRFYRLAYNLFSLISLTVPLLFSLYLQFFEIPVFVWGGWLDIVRYGFLGLSLLLFFGGAGSYDLSYFAGISQLRTGCTSVLLGDAMVFKTAGIAGITRHPWYLGGIVFAWSAPNTVYPSTLMIAGIVTLYFVYGTLLEERKLLACYGESYREYQQKVSMLIPFKWLFRPFWKP